MIVTDKVFLENPELSKHSCIRQIEELLNVKVIVIPRQPRDFTGHADGIVRYYDEHTVLVNKYREDDHPHFQGRLLKALRNANLEIVTVPYAVYENARDIDATGVYINFLELRDFIFVPTFDIPADTEVLNAFRSLYPHKYILSINAREIAKEGGVLNCITWTLKLKHSKASGK